MLDLLKFDFRTYQLVFQLAFNIYYVLVFPFIVGLIYFFLNRKFHLLRRIIIAYKFFALSSALIMFYRVSQIRFMYLRNSDEDIAWRQAHPLFLQKIYVDVSWVLILFFIYWLFLVKKVK